MPSPISSCLTKGEYEPPPSFPTLTFPFPFFPMDNQAPTFLALFIYLWIGNKDPILRLFGVRTGMVGLHKVIRSELQSAGVLVRCVKRDSYEKKEQIYSD
ncbi:hypothetical protein AAHE18_04G038800 [Arachis hypogaea]